MVSGIENQFAVGDAATVAKLIIRMSSSQYANHVQAQPAQLSDLRVDVIVKKGLLGDFAITIAAK